MDPPALRAPYPFTPIARVSKCRAIEKQNFQNNNFERVCVEQRRSIKAAPSYLITTVYKRIGRKQDDVASAI